MSFLAGNGSTTPVLDASALGPDVEQAKTGLKASSTAASHVTQYAQATLTAIPTLKQPPDWFEPIQGHLATAQAHAKSWLQSLCPAVTVGVPRGVVDYSNTFENRAGQVLALLQQMKSQGGSPSPAQRAAVTQAITDLAAALDHQHGVLQATQKRLIAYSDDVQADQDVLAADLGAVSQRFVDSHVWVQELTATLGENFLDSSQLGPCVAIVEINMQISMKIGSSGSDPSIVALVIAKAILQNQLNNSTAAQLALQSVIDSWATLKAKNEAVLRDLQDARDAQYCAVLAQVDLNTARAQWKQLSDFARGLMP